MKLWKISQDKNNDWDTYDSAVVAAQTEAEAKMMHPSTGEAIKDEYSSSWVGSPDDVTCEYIGEAKDETEKGVVFASFNAG